MHPLDIEPELYGMGRHTTAHLYAVPVLAAFDAIRNCSHCRRNTDDDCKAWREARKAVAVLTQEARRLAKGVDELRDATGGCAATIYQFACGSVAYFAPDAPDFQEAGELVGDELAAFADKIVPVQVDSRNVRVTVREKCHGQALTDQKRIIKSTR